MNPESFETFQSILGHSFGKTELLREALTHKSFLNELRGSEKENHQSDNERLEFLGDSVLGLAISECLIEKYPSLAEGELSKRRARLVSEGTLARLARDIRLGEFLFLGKGEEQTQGREKPSLLADALEAVFAAVYLDGGYEASRKVISHIFEGEILHLDDETGDGDYKTEVQELCQREFETLPVYRVVRETGPDHKKTFEITLTIRSRTLGTGTGRSKKEAEQEAARQALEKIRKSLT